MKTIEAFYYHWSYKFYWLRIFNSPFKWPKLFFYFGKIQHGTPYFLPRKTVRYNQKDMEEAAAKRNKKLQELIDTGAVSAEKAIFHKPEEFKKYKKFVPRKFGWDITALGWKTKFDQYRFEWAPSFSFVAFNRQLFIYANISDNEWIDHYWEYWLEYDRNTNTKDNKKKRLLSLLDRSGTYINYYSKQGKRKVYPFEYILKNKYKKIFLERKYKENT